MKIILVIFLLTFLGFFNSASAATVTNTNAINFVTNKSAVSTSGLVGHWTFDQGKMTQTTATDLSGNGNTGTLAGGVTKVLGKLGQGLTFNGSTGLVNLPSLGTVNAPFSISVWVKPLPVSNYGGIVGLRDGYIDSFAYYTTGNIIFGNFNSTYGSWTGMPTLLNGRWHHLVIVADTSTSATLYYDGANMGKGTSLATLGGAWTGTPRIGRSAGATSDYFNGSIDDVRIYSRALSASEVKQLYHLGAAKMVIPQPSERGLVGYWTFDQGNVGTTSAKDSSRGNNTGYFFGGVTKTSGKLGQGLAFDGSTGVVSNFSKSISPTGTSRTVCSWIYPTKTTRGGIMGTRGSGNAGWVFVANRTTAGNLTYFHTTGTTVEVAAGVTANSWQHVCAVYNNSAATVKLYRNGSQVGATATSVSVDSAGQNGEIGNEESEAFTNSFQGKLDDVRIYNRALSDAEITTLYKYGVAKITTNQNMAQKQNNLSTGLVGYWTFDGKDTGLTYATDKSGNNNTGTFVGGIRKVAGKIGQGLKFDGVDGSYVNIPQATNLHIAGPITISAWLKTSFTGIGTQIFSSYDVNTPFGGYALGMSQVVNGRISYWGGAGAGTWKESNSTINDGKWHHVVVVVSGTTARFYKDGVADGTPTAQQPTTYAGGAAIGARTDGTATSQFPGLLDEIRIYNRALSASEVSQLYRLGK